jgi:ribosomal protein L12E/L44/L45/RPP1/RPP2
LAAYGRIYWWLKRRCARLEVITAIETRYAGLKYAGGSAQQKAAAFHAQAQAQGDWREDGAYHQREEETTAPFFGGFGGA